MPVVTTGELDQFRPSGNAASDTDRAHGCFGSTAYQSHPFDARNSSDDQLGDAGLILSRCTIRSTAFSGSNDRFDHSRFGMPQDHRSPRTDVVQIAIAIDIVEMLAMSPVDKQWMATHSAESASGRVHSTGNQFAGPFVGSETFASS